MIRSIFVTSLLALLAMSLLGCPKRDQSSGAGGGTSTSSAAAQQQEEPAEHRSGGW